MKLIETVKPREVHVLPGNHDREHSINLLDNVVAELKKRNVNVVYHRDDEYYVYDKILVLRVIPCSSGSDYTGLTPLIQNNLIPLSLQHGADIIVLRHYHRSVIIRYMAKLIIALPSFQYSSKPLRNERGIIMLRGDEVKIVHVEPTKRAKLIELQRNAIKIFFFFFCSLG